MRFPAHMRPPSPAAITPASPDNSCTTAITKTAAPISNPSTPSTAYSTRLRTESRILSTFAET